MTENPSFKPWVLVGKSVGDQGVTIKRNREQLKK
jgi:hypothetical protein